MRCLSSRWGMPSSSSSLDCSSGLGASTSCLTSAGSSSSWDSGSALAAYFFVAPWITRLPYCPLHFDDQQQTLSLALNCLDLCPCHGQLFVWDRVQAVFGQK